MNWLADTVIGLGIAFVLLVIVAVIDAREPLDVDLGEADSEQ